ncbi:MAG: N-acetylmuramoyl-L-alanine amidase [Candidatus Aenigmatarchaeota archaeon]
MKIKKCVNSKLCSGYNTNNSFLKEKNHAKKGLASLEILITTFFILAMLFIFGALAINNTIKHEELAMLQKDVVNVKNTFSLFNRSLDSTWSFSTVQALYEASESGFEPTVVGTDAKAYWYRFHSEKEYDDIKLPAVVDSQSASQTGQNSVPNRCSNGNPGMCLPQSANVQNAMNMTMEKIWFDLGSVPYTVLENPVKITIPAKIGTNSQPVAQADQNKLDINVINFWPAGDRFFYEIATHVIIEGYRTDMNTYAISNGYITTGLGKMIKIGWMAVGIAIKFRYDFINFGQDLKYDKNTPGYSYIESNFKRQLQMESNEMMSIAGTNNIIVGLDTDVSFRVPVSDEFSKDIKKGAGLLAYYETNIEIAEGEKVVSTGPMTGISDACENVVGPVAMQKYKAYESYISKYVTQYDLSKYVDSPQALVAAIITIESNWDKTAQSGVEARGLMQIMPGTAPECSPDSYNDMFDPEKNIRCGIIVFINKMNAMKNYAATKEDLLKLSVAAYNGGQGYVQGLVNNHGKKYSDIEDYLNDETKDYVRNFMPEYSKWQLCTVSAIPSIVDRRSEMTKRLGISWSNGRSGNVDAIVIHHCGGAYTGCVNTLMTGPYACHYVISKTGEITRLVSDENMAACTGDYNSRSIGIETDGSGDDWTPELMNSLANLVRYLADKYKISKVRLVTPSEVRGGNGIVGHREVGLTYGYGKPDPANFNWDEFIKVVNRNSGLNPQQAAVDIVKNIDDYKILIEQKASAIVSLENNYCEERDDNPLTGESSRGNVHLAYDIIYQSPVAKVVSAYDGEIILATNNPSSYLGSCGGVIMVKSRIGSEDIIISYSNILDPEKIPLIGKQVKKGDVIGIIASGCKRYGNSPYLELRIFKASFKVPSQADSKNVCGMQTDCWKDAYRQNADANGYVNIESYIGAFNRGEIGIIPYWCSAIKWESGMLFHESINPVRGKNLRYYEDTNEFKQESFKIKFSMEDWFPVLDCTQQEELYQWQSPGDMLCYDSKLYTCERQISGLPSEQILNRTKSIGPYVCLVVVSGTGYRTKFSLREPGQVPETQSSGMNNFDCLAYDPGNSLWTNLNGGFCQNDDYCSDEERITYGSEVCQYSADCCSG